MLASPRVSSSVPTSRKITDTLRELSHCAMPLPIMPAPITAACVLFSGICFELAHFLLRGVEQLVARNNLINQPKLCRFLRGIQFSFQNHFRRLLRTDQTREAPATAPSRNQTERCFGQTNPRGGIIARDSPVTCQGNFVAAARAGTVNRGAGWNF